MTWLTDDSGNKCSVEYFGSQEAAQRALDSLKNCRNCVNCSYCSYYAAAAQLIYRESGYPINPGRFYDSNADALRDMAKLAGVE